MTWRIPFANHLGGQPCEPLTVEGDGAEVTRPSSDRITPETLSAWSICRRLATSNATHCAVTASESPFSRQK